MTTFDPNCLFCKIIQGEVPSYTVFENSDVKAFLDLSQITKGHVLMVPKKHLVNLFDYTSEDAKRFLRYIPEIAQAIKASDPHILGMNVAVNNGEIAGQVIMHSHVHFIPRYSKSEDGLTLKGTNHAADYDEAAYQNVANRIKQQF